MKNWKRIILSIAMLGLIISPATQLNVQAETLPSRYKLFGDVNGNGAIDTGDLLLVQRHMAAKGNAETYKKHRDWVLTGAAFTRGDVNRDGSVNIGDQLLLQRHLAVLSGATTNLSWRLVTVYLDYGTSVGRSNCLLMTCLNAANNYNARGNIERDLLNDPKYTFTGWYTKPVGGTRVYGTWNVGTSNQILYAHYKVNTIYVSDVKLSSTYLILTAGKGTKLTATVLPSNATNKEVNWTSSNRSVASVDSSGNVTAKEGGIVKITVTTKDGGHSKSATVMVLPKPSTGAEDVYKKAKAQLGKKYPVFKSKGFHYRAWCADFVSWCAKQTGQSKAIPWNSTVAGIRTAIKNAGGKEYSKAKIQSGSYVPKRGDIIIFKSSGASHVGIVDYAKNSKIYYIDGNNTTNGNGNNACVHYSSCSYSDKKLTCVLHPNYK